MKSKLKRLAGFYRDRENQRRYWTWMVKKTKPFMPSIMLLLGLDIFLALVSIGTVLINKYLIDGATAPGGGLNGGYLALLIGLTVLSILIGAGTGILTTLVHEKYGFSIRSKVFDRVLRSDWQTLSSYHSGDAMTRLTSDIDTVANGIASAIPSVIYLIVRLVAAFVVLYRYDAFLALAALVLGPLGVLGSLIFAEKLKRYQEKLKENESQFRSFMQESVANVTVVKTFQCEDKFSARLADLRGRRLKIVMKRNITNTALRTVMSVVFSGGYVLAFAWGIYRLSRGEITYGTMSVFLALVSQVQGPIMQLSNVIPQIINVLASAGRVIEIDEMRQETPGKAETLSGRVGVRLTDVSFSYRDEPVLRDVTVDIRPGETVGIVGTSGIGKTTMARIILALVSPGSGTAEFYGEDGGVEAATPSSRRLVAYVPQGNTLLSGTVRENLLTGCDGADDGELMRALEIADAADFVSQLPNGLDTALSERAGTLSEGQAQRIAIARAILRRCPVMILDEATSALDIATENRIVGNLKTLVEGLTCIVITHRPSLLGLCGETYTIADGRLAL